MGNELLQTKSVQASYGKLKVLHNINFNVDSSDRILLIGPNGAGKSTLLKSICGLHKEMQGKIIFRDEDITKDSVKTRVEKGIVYLKQEKDIFPGLTVEENLKLGGYYLSSENFEERLDNLLQYFTILKDKMDKRAGLLSGGERRTLGIAMVLIKEPELLLLDEPTAGLAPATAKSILTEIFKLLNHHDTTMVVVEHKLSLILDIVKNVNIMVNGKIVEDELAPQKIKEDPEILDEYYFG